MVENSATASKSPEDFSNHNPPSFSDLAVVASLAFATLMIHLGANGGYGYFRDELYYLACGQHLAWGYVDQPPMIAWIAAFSRWAFGNSLRDIRFLPAVAGAGKVFLTGLLAKELGGRRYAQGLACVAVVLAPIYLGIDNFLSMNAFEPLFWMGCAYVALRIFNGASPRLWLVFGVLAGLGLENKHSMLFFGFGFAVGLLLTRHWRVFLQPWIWMGGLIAVLIFLPNLLWEVHYHWPTLQLLENIKHSNKNAPITLLSFLSGQVIMLNPLSILVWLPGLAWYFTKNGERFRPLGWTYIVMFATFVILQGKVYYLAPAYPMLFAAGGVVWEQSVRHSARMLRPALVALLIVTGAVLAPFAAPILPVETYIAYAHALHLSPPQTENNKLGKLQQQYADMFGWPEMVATVATVYGALTPEEKQKCAIFAQNYGEAGALDFFGPRYGLPKAISGHQSYFLWGPRNYTGEVMIVLDDSQQKLQQYFEQVELKAVFTNPYCMPSENNLKIFLCRGLKVPLKRAWPQLKHWM